ncbi:MAG: class I SAM-dependent methyltransferase [Candidatus Saccharimonadales bacterium]
MTTIDTTSNDHQKNSDWYNDPEHNYRDYWKGRGYEDAAERMAIKRLLDGKHFRHAVDIGGGYGRLCIFLENYADKVTLTDPSQQQLDIAKDYLKDHPEIDRQIMQVEQMDFADGSVDLLTIVRILHHIPHPEKAFAEIARVLSTDGYFLMEFANYGHARNRLRHFLRGEDLPKEPVDIRPKAHQTAEYAPFVNHNPLTIKKQLKEAGLEVKRILSVSNLRSPALKKIVPHNLMLAVEGILQPALSRVYFGPSVFFLIHKAK